MIAVDDERLRRDEVIELGPILRWAYWVAAGIESLHSQLVKERLIAPMVQQIFRRGMAGIAGDREAYMSGRAHPSVFQGGAIDLATGETQSPGPCAAIQIELTTAGDVNR